MDSYVARLLIFLLNGTGDISQNILKALFCIEIQNCSTFKCIFE